MPPARASTRFPRAQRRLVVACISLAAAVLVLTLTACRPPAPEAPTASPQPGSESRIAPETAAEFAAIEARERSITETVWAREVRAARCGRVFEDLWDALNAATNKLEHAASFAVSSVIPPRWDLAAPAPHGITVHTSSSPAATLDDAAWRSALTHIRNDGWRLVQCEFRHTRFDLDDAGKPSRSRLLFSAHLVREARAERPAKRAAVEGDLFVDWIPVGAVGAMEPAPSVRSIDASQLVLKTRRGEPPFIPVLEEAITPPRNSLSIDPLILHDLDGDGLSEIVLAGRNLVFRRTGPDRFQSAPLSPHSYTPIYTAVMADFDGDGATDLLAQKFEGLVLLKGSPRGTFEDKERRVWRAPSDVRFPMVLTCGDIDHDGDLDVFLGQYRDPFEGGAAPTPYFAANNGLPSYLLRNDGTGGFTDITDAAGLGLNRRRRIYSASFIDLDGDRHPDLVTVSDFAGVDIYRNDGRGTFTEATSHWIRQPHAFGMAHAFSDFNADGRLDFLMIGMPSATVDRLEQAGLWRPDDRSDRSMRAAMARGNRLYLGQPDGSLAESPAIASIARSGWSWGVGAADFDNDGFPDAYIANGLESRATVRDYEGEYWLHDQHVGGVGDNPAALLYFKARFAQTRGRGMSYGGYEKNRLYLNRAGESFLEAGQLLGVALEQDSRNVVTDDLDGDGRVDLVVTSFETWPEAKQTLRVYRNTLTGTGNWIGFRFREEGRNASPTGVRVTIHHARGTAVHALVTGDSHRSQHATTTHFGLGAADDVAKAVIVWPDGRQLILTNPAVNRYHAVRAPVSTAASGIPVSAGEQSIAER